jgi:hypothetical protein
VAVDYVANLVTAVAAAPLRDRNGASALLAASVRATARGESRSLPPDTPAIVGAYAVPAQLLLDDDAHVDTILSAMATAPVVHCIGHGDVDRNRVYEHAIRFADGRDGVLTGERCSGAPLRGAIVVLGSCRAGEAPLRRGGDPLSASLAGAMLTAGARCVIVPTTDVGLRRHLDGATWLHRALAQGALPADALLAARQAARASGDRLAVLELLSTQVHGRGF